MSCWSEKVRSGWARPFAGGRGPAGGQAAPCEPVRNLIATLACVTSAKSLVRPMSDQVVAPGRLSTELEAGSPSTQGLCQALNEQTTLWLEQASRVPIFSNNLDEFSCAVGFAEVHSWAGVTSLSDDGLTPGSNFRDPEDPSGHC